MYKSKNAGPYEGLESGEHFRGELTIIRVPSTSDKDFCIHSHKKEASHETEERRGYSDQGCALAFGVYEVGCNARWRRCYWETESLGRLDRRNHRAGLPGE